MSIQLPLVFEEFQPLPGGKGQYVVALQNKKGELEALTHASAETRQSITPVIHVVGSKKGGKVRSETVCKWITKIGSAVGPYPCFLDVSRLKIDNPVISAGGTVPVLPFLYEQARSQGLRFVPVFPIQGSEQHRRFVHEAFLQDARGLAIRLNPLGSVPLPGSNQTEDISQLLVDFEVEPGSIDLLIDLGCLSADVDLDPNEVRNILDELSDVGDWRNIILLGTSIPPSLGTIKEGGVGTLSRQEWQLWRDLNEKPPKRLPTFGDYAVQHPRPPQETSGGIMRANIRYTIDDSTLVLRGVGPVTEDGKNQYRQLCRELVSRKEYSGPDYSWGDKIIKDCADGLLEPGGQNMWRGAGTSHHLRFITDRLVA